MKRGKEGKVPQLNIYTYLSQSTWLGIIIILMIIIIKQIICPNMTEKEKIRVIVKRISNK